MGFFSIRRIEGASRVKHLWRGNSWDRARMTSQLNPDSAVELTVLFEPGVRLP